MSHFALLVIGDNPEAQLQQFHEFECTGTDDQYVEDIDITEDLRKEFAEETKSMIRIGDDLVSEYDDRFYREFTEEELQKVGGRTMLGTGCGHGMSWSSRDWGDSQGYRAKVHDTSGHEVIEVPVREVTAFAEWVEDWHGKKCIKEGEQPDLAEAHKYGYVVVDKTGNLVKGIDRTNPNKKWDYWRLGGRYGGRLILKPGCEGEKAPPNWDSPESIPATGVADRACKGDVDFEAMRAKAESRAASLWDKAHTITRGVPWESWDHVRDVRHKDDIKAARKFYHDQPSVIALKASKDQDFTWEIDDNLSGSREDFIAEARKNAVSAFAVLKDGQWHERGKMGWWACVSDEKDQVDWQDEFNQLLDGQPDDTMIGYYDCHI